MKFEQTRHAWEIAFPEQPWLRQRLDVALANRDCSLIAEFCAGAWLMSEGHRILKAELAKDRILSPRRRESGKTCDFEIVAEGQRSGQFVEVKHTQATGDGSVGWKQFAQSAYLKGARWLIVVLFRKVSSSFHDVTHREIETGAWAEFVSEKQVLKFRKNGFTRITLLEVS